MEATEVVDYSDELVGSAEQLPISSVAAPEGSARREGVTSISHAEAACTKSSTSSSGVFGIGGPTQCQVPVGADLVHAEQAGVRGDRHHDPPAEPGGLPRSVEGLHSWGCRRL